MTFPRSFARFRPWGIAILLAFSLLYARDAFSQPRRNRSRSAQGGPRFAWVPEDTIGFGRMDEFGSWSLNDPARRRHPCLDELSLRLSVTYLLVPREGPVAYTVSFGSADRDAVEACTRDDYAARGVDVSITRVGRITRVAHPPHEFSIGFGTSFVVVGTADQVARALDAPATRDAIPIDRMLPFLDAAPGAFVHLLDVAREVFGVSCPGVVLRLDESTMRLTCPSSDRADELVQAIERLRATIGGSRADGRSIRSASIERDGSDVILRSDSAGMDLFRGFVAFTYTRQIPWMTPLAPRSPSEPAAEATSSSSTEPRLPTRADVGTTLSRAREAVRACFTSTGTTGVVSTQVTFDPSGAVESVRVEGVDPDSPSTECVRQAIRGVRLPHPLTRHYTVSFPYRY